MQGSVAMELWVGTNNRLMSGQRLEKFVVKITK